MLGEKIRKARKNKGFTLKELAEKINVTHSALSQIENEKNEASKKTLIALAKELNDNFGEAWLDEHLVKNLNNDTNQIDERFEIMSLKFDNLKGNKKVKAEVLIDVLERELDRLANEN